jgi:tetratricopeptide (TPR) repeat protein
VTGVIVSCFCAAQDGAAEKNSEGELKQLLAESYMTGGEYEKAVAQYRENLKNDPDDTETRVSLADVLSWMKKYDESITEYKKALKIRSGDVQIEEKLAQVYVWAKDYKNAEELYKKILAKDPNNTDAGLALGEILTWQERYPEAIKYFTEASETGESVRGRMLYGRALLYSGQYSLAENVFKKILTEQPDNFETKVYLGDTFAYSKNFNKAIRLYREALSQKEDLEVVEKLADVLSWSKRYREALSLYDKILEKKEDPEIMLQKARVFGWAKEYNKSLKEYQKILDEKYDKNVELEMNGKKAYWSGRVKTAISNYSQLIKEEPENAEAMFDLSQVYSYQSMWKQAARVYEEILAFSPNHFRAKEGLEKATLIARHVSYETNYEYFEAYSPSRDNDINKHMFFNRLNIPLSSKFYVDVDYRLTGRNFSDYPHLIENEGRIKATYLSMPNWQISGYYGLIGYSGDLDKIMHLFGERIAVRVFDAGNLTFAHNRRRLENISKVIREYQYRDDFKPRLDVDVGQRLKLGADYLFSYYSDGNDNNEPGFDFKYYLSLDPMRVVVKYRYFYREFNKKTKDYFSPKGFSTSKFSLNWRHYLNKEEIFFGADDLYYDLRYDVAIDSTYVVGHTFAWEFNWDINKRLNFNVKGSITGSSANVYRDNNLTAALKYYF